MRTSKGASEKLVKIMKEYFNSTVKFTISERGNQRIEISNKKQTWQTLEATFPPDDKDNFDDISAMIMSAIAEQLP